MKPCPKCAFELYDLAQRCSNCGFIDPHKTGGQVTPKKEPKTKSQAPPKREKQGREVGTRNPKTQHLIPKVLELKYQGGSLRQISKQTGLNKRTVATILPPFDKHITPKARNVLDKCLTTSFEVFNKAYQNNKGDERDKFDAFIETQVEFLQPMALTKTMLTWSQQLSHVGDNAFVHGAIYSLLKVSDYFSSIRESEPPEQ